MLAERLYRINPNREIFLPPLLVFLPRTFFCIVERKVSLSKDDTFVNEFRKKYWVRVIEIKNKLSK